MLRDFTVATQRHFNCPNGRLGISIREFAPEVNQNYLTGFSQDVPRAGWPAQAIPDARADQGPHKLFTSSKRPRINPYLDQTCDLTNCDSVG